MKKIELLSPAGDLECLKAAISGGANAVYLAGKSFGARGYAKNFSNDELISAINLAHLYDVKIYVTCNTLIYDSEIKAFVNYIEFLHKNNVDAVILQDIGMADLIHKTFPNLEIHSSTQMNIHNENAVIMATKLGCKRVVLAREMPIEDIKSIVTTTKADVEVFAHGALCLSYSGGCLISNEIGKRSANRGLCAGTCRLKYNILSDDKVVEDDIYALSCKDLISIDNIPNLISAGISSLKIEGRMKRPEYVFLTTSLYRKAIDAYYNKEEFNYFDSIKELKKIYNRQFTKGFLNNEDNNNLINDYRPNHQGIEIGKILTVSKKYIEIKLTDDVSINDGLRVLNDREDVGILLNNFYINNKLTKNASSGDIIRINKHYNVTENDKIVKTSDYIQLSQINQNILTISKKIPITMRINIKLNQPLLLELDDGKNTVLCKSDAISDIARKTPINDDDVISQLKKIQNTPFCLLNIEVSLEDNLFVPLKVLNDLRRQAINLLIKKREYISDFKKCTYQIELPNFHIQENKYYLVDENFDFNTLDKQNIILNKYQEEINYACKLPRVMNKNLVVQNHVLVSELGSILSCKSFDTDFSFNVTNAYSVALLHNLGAKKVTLSYELNFSQIKTLIDNYKVIFKKIPNVEVIVYGRKELMISKYNMYNKYKHKNLFLEDKFNNQYKIINNNDYMSVYDYKISTITDDLFSVGVNNIRYNLEYTNIKNISDLESKPNK